MEIRTTIVKKRYPNAIEYKFDSKRVIVLNRDNNFGLVFKTLDSRPEPCVYSQFFKNKLHITSMNLSKKAGQLLMIALAEMFNMELIEKQSK